MRTLPTVARLLVAALVAGAVACGGGGGSGDGGDGSSNGPELEGFAVERLDVHGTEFAVWIAETDQQRRRGFMFATEEQLAPLADGTPRGMLFLFGEDSRLGFWMRDTGVPLDLAYLAADGRIAEIHHLAPFDETPVVATMLVRHAFETRAGTLSDNGITVGDRVELPAR